MNANTKSTHKILAAVLLIVCLCISFVGCTGTLDIPDPTGESILMKNPSTTNKDQFTGTTESATVPDAKETVPLETESAPTETVHVHNYTNNVSAPSCTTGGYTTFICSCGDTYTTDYTDPSNHNYVSKVKTATCTEKGYTTYTCAVCGDTYIANQTDATGHNYREKVTAATCTEKGYTSYTCSDCGDSYTGNKIAATGHSWGCWRVVREPTATTEGAEERTCESCSKVDTRSMAKLPTYETFDGVVGVYNAHNLAYIDWKGDTEQAAFIEVYSVINDDSVLNDLAMEFEKVYGFAPSLGNKYRCITACEQLGTYMVDGYSEPQTVYHYSITDKTYIYITNDMYEVYVQECDDGSVWVGYCIYATMDTLGDERSKAEIQALDQEMYAIFEELIGLSRSEMNSYKEELELKIGYISEAGTVRSIHSDEPVQVLYIYCRGFALSDTPGE